VCFTILFAVYNSSCDDSGVITTGEGCSKIPDLIFPPSDTSLSNATVDFRWFEPSCLPSHYKLIIYNSSFNDTTLTPFTIVSKTLAVNNTYFWKVTAYYTNPADSATSFIYDFFIQP